MELILRLLAAAEALEERKQKANQLEDAWDTMQKATLENSLGSCGWRANCPEKSAGPLSAAGCYQGGWLPPQQVSAAKGKGLVREEGILSAEGAEKVCPEPQPLRSPERRVLARAGGGAL